MTQPSRLLLPHLGHRQLGTLSIGENFLALIEINLVTNMEPGGGIATYGFDSDSQAIGVADTLLEGAPSIRRFGLTGMSAQLTRQLGLSDTQLVSILISPVVCRAAGRLISNDSGH